jgi:hypothetical protein
LNQKVLTDAVDVWSSFRQDLADEGNDCCSMHEKKKKMLIQKFVNIQVLKKRGTKMKNDCNPQNVSKVQFCAFLLLELKPAGR